LGNIVGFINNTRPESIIKPPNCLFEGPDGNWIVVCAIKTIAKRKELLIDYDLNQIDTYTAIMGVLMFF